jgi:putative transposase
MAVSRPPRIPGFAYNGLYRYFLTYCTFQRRPTFTRSLVVDRTLEQFQRTAGQQAFEILAYCFMPDHVHLLVEGTMETSDLRRFSKLAKQCSGAAYARENHHPLWQEGYYDRVLRDGENIKNIARYLLNNPIRAGLAASPADYPYLGSVRWTLADLLDGQI